MHYPITNIEERLTYVRWHLGEARKSGDSELMRRLSERLARLEGLDQMTPPVS